MNQDPNNFNQQANGNFNNQNQPNYQDLNMTQNTNINQSAFNNTIENNNMYQQSIKQNNVTYTNTTNNNKKIKIIALIAVVIVALFICIMLFSKNSFSSSGGYTAEYGETLKVNEIEGYYDFEVEVLSIEKDYSINSYFYNGDCLALKVKIKNNSDYDLSILAFINFTLLDSSNNKVGNSNIISNSTIDGSIKNEISSSQSETGYLYFYNIDSDGNGSNINSNDISKLKISVPKELDMTDDTITGNYNYYYINLK